MASQLASTEIRAIISQLDDCDAEKFLSNFDQWFNTLIDPIETLAEIGSSEKQGVIPRAAVVAFCRLLPVAAKHLSVTKGLNSLGIHRLIQPLVKCPPWFDRWALMGINSCLAYFHDGCKKNFSKTILPFARRCMDSTDDQIRQRAAYCIALFPKLAGITVGGGIWNQQLAGVIFSLHEIIIKLAEPFEAHNENCNVPVLPSSRGRPAESVDRTVFFYQLFDHDRRYMETEISENRARLFLDVLIVMSSEFTNLAVTIDLQDISDLLSCLVNVLETLVSPKPIFIEVAAQLAVFIGEKLLPNVTISAAPFAPRLVDGSMRLFSRCLREVNPTGYNAVSSALVLSTAIANYIGPASSQAFERLVSNAMSYIDPMLQMDEVLAQHSEPKPSARKEESAKESAKKRKAALLGEMASNQVPIQRSRGTIPDYVKTSFLQMWIRIVESGGCLIRANDFGRLQQTVCQLILRLQADTKKTEQWSMNEPDCRAALYTLLCRLVTCQHPSRPSSMHCAIGIFENGIRQEEHPEVVEACNNGLMVCGSLAKPIVPCLETVAIEKNGDSAENDSVAGPSGTNGASASNFLSNVASAVEETDSGKAEESKAAARVATDTSKATNANDEDQREENGDHEEVDGDGTSTAGSGTITLEDDGTSTAGAESVIVDGDGDDDDDETGSVVYIENMDTAVENERSDKNTDAGRGAEELNAMLADFVDEPAEETETYLD